MDAFDDEKCIKIARDAYELKSSKYPFASAKKSENVSGECTKPIIYTCASACIHYTYPLFDFAEREKKMQINSYFLRCRELFHVAEA